LKIETIPKRRTMTERLAQTGALDRDRKRHQTRLNEPAAVEFGGCPEFLSPKQQEAWAWIVDRCPAGVLRRSDEPLVAACAVLFAQILAEPEKATPAALSRLHGMLSSMGMTPSDRSRVAVEPKPTRSRLREILEMR
jgi:hypothetical protein